MPNTTYQAGATSKIIGIRAFVASTGLPYTAGVFNTATIAATYTRDGATVQTITLVTASAGTYTSSGFVHAGKGEYELGVPTAALASGADGVRFKIDGITDVVFEEVRVELTGTDPRSAAVPDVNVSTINGQAASAAAGVTFPSSIASPTNITAGVITTATNVTNDVGITQTGADKVWGTTTRALTDKVGFALSTAGILAIWHQLLSAIVTAGTIGKLIVDYLDAAISSRGTSTYAGGAVASVTGNVGGNVVGSVGSVAGAVGSVTGNVGGNVVGSVASVTAAVSVTGDLSATMKASVNAEVVDVLSVDTSAELSAPPAAASSIRDRLAWIFLLGRNKITQTATTQTVLADDGTTTVATATVSDDSTTASRGEFV